MWDNGVVCVDDVFDMCLVTDTTTYSVEILCISIRVYLYTAALTTMSTRCFTISFDVILSGKEVNSFAVCVCVSVEDDVAR